MGDKSSTLEETCFYKVKTSKMNKEDVDVWYSLFLNQRTNVRSLKNGKIKGLFQKLSFM